MTTIKVGDWVRSTNSTHIKKVTWLTIDGMSAHFNDGSSARVCDCVKVIVRDAPKPRKIKASELWAWLHEENLVMRPWYSDDEQSKWCVELYVSSTVAFAVGPTPLKAIIAARKALMKAKHMIPEDILDDNK